MWKRDRIQTVDSSINTFKLLILGCNSATPKINSHPTSQYLNIKGYHFLIDCGEGTQVQLHKYKVKFSKISHIFISHLHGDHYYGLPGLISSFNLMDRKKPLIVFGPKGLKEILDLIIKNSQTKLKFDLIIYELEKKSIQIILDNDHISVETIPLNHRIYTNGFLFRQKAKEQKKPLSYAFCSDTAFNPEIVPQLKNIDLLYHESTFLEKHKHLAITTKHSTAREAAKIAREAQVGKLILGHYSSRYSNIQLFLYEAQPIFPNTHISHEGKLFELEML